MNQTMLDLINYNMRHSPTGKLLGNQLYKLKAQDLEVLDRFSNRTILTLGTDVTKWILQAETPRLACLVSHNTLHINTSFYLSVSAVHWLRFSKLNMPSSVSEADKDQHPFLMHAVLAFTYSHDRLLRPVPEKASAAELFHNYKSTALFNYRLNDGDVTSSERDAIVSHPTWYQLHLLGLSIMGVKVPKVPEATGLNRY